MSTTEQANRAAEALDEAIAGSARPVFADETDYLRMHRRRLLVSIAAMSAWPAGRHADVASFCLQVPMAMARLGHRVTAIDLPYMAEGAETREEFARRLAEFGVEFRAWPHSAGAALPVANGEFDSLSCFETLEHIAGNHWRIAAEWRRALKPGGRLIVSVPNVLRATRLLGILTGSGFPPTLDEMHRAPYDTAIHFREYRASELARLIAESGFRIVRAWSEHTVPLASQGTRALELKRAAEPLAGLWPFGGDTLFVEATC